MTIDLTESIARLIQEGEKVTALDDKRLWSQKSEAFIRAAMPEEHSAFSNLSDGTTSGTHALRLGHLFGLVARLQAALSEEKRQATNPAFPRSTQASPPAAVGGSRRVFVVHGHDGAAKESLARFLTKLTLDPIVLHEQASAGRTIIEKFETYSGDVAFAVVLLTPDDVGSARGEQSKMLPRARQNVILELGYFMGRLGRTNVCALHKGGVELPSDYQGVVYIDMDDANGWKTKLAQEFVQAKLPIDLSGLLGG